MEAHTESDEIPARHRRERREDVRSRLLAAAIRVFSERGYEGASLERVAEAAGFSKGAVYSNFASKDELFFSLVASRIDERIKAVHEATKKQAASASTTAKAPAGENAAESAARVAGKVLRAAGEADPEWQLLFLEFWLRCARNDALRSNLSELRREMRGRIADLVEAEAKTAGASISRGEAMDLATTSLALSNGLGIEGIIDPEAVSPNLFSEILSRIVAGSSIAAT